MNSEVEWERKREQQVHLEAPQLVLFFLLKSCQDKLDFPCAHLHILWNLANFTSFFICSLQAAAFHAYNIKEGFISFPSTYICLPVLERGTVSVSVCLQSCLSVLTDMHLHSSRVAAAALPLQINLSNCIRNSLFFFARESQAEPQTRRHRNMSLGLHSPQLHVHWLCLSLLLSLSPSFCLVFFCYFALVCQCDSFYTFHFIVTYAFIS